MRYAIGSFSAHVVIMTGLALTCLGCTTHSQSDVEAQGTVGRTKYSVPLEFSPEPGELDEGRGVQLIDDPQLSVLVTGDMLADAISGFDPRHLGAIHDTMVIVQNFSEEEVGDWSPTDVMIRNREDIWRREGHMASACIDDEPDPLTGLIRYTTLCDPEPQPRSSFFLLDRRPEPGQKKTRLARVYSCDMLDLRKLSTTGRRTILQMHTHSLDAVGRSLSVSVVWRECCSDG